jgi:hypothetical protein
MLYFNPSSSTRTRHCRRFGDAILAVAIDAKSNIRRGRRSADILIERNEARDN